MIFDDKKPLKYIKRTENDNFGVNISNYQRTFTTIAPGIRKMTLEIMKKNL